MRTTLRRLSQIFVLGLAGTVAMGTVLAGPAGATTPAEEKMVRLINRERVERGENRLQIKTYLVRNARTHSDKMADAGDWFHNDRLARQLADRPWNTLGENVGHAPTVWSMHRWFMHSSAHRHNILDGDFDRIGIGIVRRDGTLWFTQVFTG